MSAEKYSPKIEAVIDYLDHGEKPWFLSTSAIYQLVKKTSEYIPYSPTLFEKSLDGLSFVTKYINESTRLNVVINADQANELISKIDSILSENLVILDDGLDGLRAKFSSHLRQLLVALVNHKKWAETFAESTAEETMAHVQSRYEQGLVFVHTVVETVRQRFPFVFEKAQQSLDTLHTLVHSTQVDEARAKFAEIKSFLHDWTLVGALQHVLKTAQPYVHKAVTVSKPYLLKTLDVSKPILVQAQPHVDRWVAKANDTTESLKSNKVLGPYVDSVLLFAQSALEDTKEYIVPPEEHDDDEGEGQGEREDETAISAAAATAAAIPVADQQH